MKKKTQEQYIEELKIKNPNIVVIENYKGAKTKILHKCLICECEWRSTPTNILNGNGCPDCNFKYISKKYTLSNEEYLRRLSLKNYPVFPLENYKGTHIKILHQCKKCGYKWLIEPSKVLNNRGCPRCANNLKKTMEQYESELNKINKNLEILETYKNYSTPIKHKCKIHNYIWKARPSDLLQGKSCPMCKSSRGERKIENFLTEIGIEFFYQYKFKNCKNIRALPFDFFIPSYNCCIEYQGIQHYFPIDIFGGQKALENTIKRDEIKKEFCKRNKINLIIIKYTDYNQIEKILKNNFIKMRRDCDSLNSNI